MANVSITITNRIASVSAGILLVCNNPTDTITFTFDAEWEAYTTRTARFAWVNDYIDVPFTGVSVTVPEIHNAHYVFVGVYANGIASAPVKIDCKRSIMSYGENEYLPPTHTNYDEFEQMLADLQNAADAAEGATTDANTAAGDANDAASAANDAADRADNAASDANDAKQSALTAAASANAIVNSKSNALVKTASGSVVQVYADEGSPMYPKLYVNATQSGTGDPSPTNVRPITGVDTVNVVCCTENLIENVEGTFNGVKSIQLPYYLPAGNYSFVADLSTNAPGASSLINFMNDNSTVKIENIARGVHSSISTNVPNKFNRIFLYSSVDGYNASINYQLTLANTMLVVGNIAPTIYSEYVGVRTQIGLSLVSDGIGGTIGTQYGGYIDFARGKYVRLYGVKRFPVIDVATSTNTTNNMNVYYALASFTNTVSDGFVMSSVGGGKSNNVSLVSGVHSNINSSWFISFPASMGIDTTEKAIEYLTNNQVMVVYELATPVEYNISDLPEITALAGVNNAYHDGNGITELTYNADALHLINELSDRITALETT